MTGGVPIVGIDFHTFDGIYQGSRSHVLGLYKEAIALAPDLRFKFFLTDHARLRLEHPEFCRENVDLERLPSVPGLARLAFVLPYLRRRHGIDLLHTQYRIPFVPLGSCACTIHDVLFEDYPEYFSKPFAWQSRLTFRLAAKRSKLLFTVSEYSRRRIAQCYGIDPDGIEVLYNGVDRTRFHPGGDGFERLSALGLQSNGYLLVVGRLEPRKNHARLIEAYSLLGPGAPPLICVGQRDFGFDAAIGAASRFGVQDRVRFLEAVADDLLPVLMRHARLFVFPAVAEGFGMPVVEAFASGVPVVTSNSSSLVEVAGDAAVLVDAMSVTGIADGMKRVLADSNLSDKLRLAGLRRSQDFDWKLSAQKLVTSYRRYFGLTP